LLADAAKSYGQALALATNDAERRFLERRLREVAPACYASRAGDA
jgi:predicted RNA polymerase sigma factor